MSDIEEKPVQAKHQVLDPEIDLIAITFHIKNNFLSFVSCGLLGAVTFILVTFLITPLYESEAILEPVSLGGQSEKLGGLAARFGGIASLAGVDIGSVDGDISTNIQVMKSRDFIVDFLDKQNIFHMILPGRWDEDSRSWSAPSMFKKIYNKLMRELYEGTPPISKLPNEEEFYIAFMDKHFSYSRDVETGLIALRLRYISPESSKILLLSFIDQLNERIRNEKQAQADKTIAYLKDEIEKTSIQNLREAAYSLVEEQARIKMLANTQKEFAFKIIDSPSYEDNPVIPNRLIAFVFGFLFGVALLYPMYAAYKKLHK